MSRATAERKRGRAVPQTKTRTMIISFPATLVGIVEELSEMTGKTFQEVVDESLGVGLVEMLNQTKTSKKGRKKKS